MPLALLEANAPGEALSAEPITVYVTGASAQRGRDLEKAVRDLRERLAREPRLHVVDQPQRARAVIRLDWPSVGLVSLTLPDRHAVLDGFEPRLGNGFVGRLTSRLTSI